MSSIKVSKICLHVLPHEKTDVIRRGQFTLDSLPVGKVREFIRGLFSLDIKDAYTWFDKLDCTVSLRREPDDDMNLDHFLSMLSKSRSFVRLQTGNPHNQIRFMAEYRLKGCEVTHFAWFECNLTPDNYKKVDDLFKRVFGVRIKDIC